MKAPFTETLQVGGSLEVRSSAAGTEVCARVPRGVPPSR